MLRQDSCLSLPSFSVVQRLSKSVPPAPIAGLQTTLLALEDVLLEQVSAFFAVVWACEESPPVVAAVVILAQVCNRRVESCGSGLRTRSTYARRRAISAGSVGRRRTWSCGRLLVINSLRLKESSSRIAVDDLSCASEEAPLVPLWASTRLPPSTAYIAKLRAAWATGDRPFC